MQTIVLALAVGTAPVVVEQPTKADVQSTGEAIEQFRSVAARDAASSLPNAITICRLAVGQAARGVTVAADAIRTYKGPGEQILALSCSSYMQGAFDVMSHTPASKTQPR